MSPLSRSRSPNREPRAPRQHRDRSTNRSRSRSPRRGKAQDRGRRVEERDRRDKHSRSRSRTRDRERHHRKSRSSSRSPRQRRHDSRSRSHSRSRSRSRDRKDKRKRRRSRSISSDSNESEDDRKRRKKEKKHKRKESRERRKERKKEKKEKKDKKKSSSSHWGKYGVITEVDLFTKGAEFHSWLVEERKINPETLSKDQERKEFAHFIEDFNTATLPHEKFYDMAKYERRMDALRQGEYLPPAEDTYDPEADMRALTGSRKKKAAERESYMSRDQLEELRKVQNERNQMRNMKLIGMDIKQTMGVRMDGTAFDDF